VTAADIVLAEGIVAGIPTRIVLRGREVVMCLASHALEIPLELPELAALGELCAKSVDRALLSGARMEPR